MTPELLNRDKIWNHIKKYFYIFIFLLILLIILLLVILGFNIMIFMQLNGRIPI